jgi:hypothetical protein
MIKIDGEQLLLSIYRKLKQQILNSVLIKNMNGNSLRDRLHNLYPHTSGN